MSHESVHANGFPDIEMPVENWKKNGSYTVRVLDTPIYYADEYKPVRYIIRIQKWIHGVSSYRANSPILNIDVSHNATKRAIFALKEEILINSTNEIRQKYDRHRKNVMTYQQEQSRGLLRLETMESK